MNKPWFDSRQSRQTPHFMSNVVHLITHRPCGVSRWILRLKNERSAVEIADGVTFSTALKAVCIGDIDGQGIHHRH